MALLRIFADRFLKLVENTLATGQSQILEYDLKVPAGQRWFEGRTAPFHLKNNDKSCVILVARDITDRKRAEELQNQNIYLQEELQTRLNFGEIVGASEAMKAVYKSMAMFAATDASVLLLGETGTGKELIARAIHQASQRKDRVMIKVNCVALPLALVESELFGHEKGAFTGAAAQYLSDRDSSAAQPQGRHSVHGELFCRGIFPAQLLGVPRTTLTKTGKVLKWR